MTKTTNYQLNQWAKSDRIRMDDFNADNAKIDAALGTIPKLAVGTYKGTGVYGHQNQSTLAIGFAAKMVVIIRADAPSAHTVFLRSCPTACYGAGTSSGMTLGLTWSDTGVSWYDYNNQSAEVQLNLSNVTYHWFAIG